MYLLLGHYYSSNCLHIFRFPDYDKVHEADVTGQQRRLTPSWHLILPQTFVDIRVYSAPDLYFSFKFSCLNTIFQNHYSFLMTCSLYYLVTIYCYFSLDRALNVNTSFDLKVTDSLGNDLVRVHFT